jgi:hypothetical protein
MSGPKQMKTATLGIVLQLTEIPESGKDRRLWEVHDVERNRGFRVTLNQKDLLAGKKAYSAPEIEGAVGLAIERFLTGSPELVAGPLYEVQVASRDLQDFAALGRSS